MDPKSQVRNSINRLTVLSLLTLGLLVVGIGGWVSVTKITGAVIAPGEVVVETHVKKVQPAIAGTIKDLRVQDGDEVKAGDVLVILDKTEAQANLTLLNNQLDELLARRARLEAEQSDAESITFPTELTERSSDPGVQQLLREQSKLFAVGRTDRAGRRSQFNQRILQLNEQIRGSEEQLAAKDNEVLLVEKELGGVRELWQKNLVQITKMISLERERARLEGERGTLRATIAQLKEKIAETELQILQLGHDLREEDSKALVDVLAKESELAQKKIAAEDKLRHLEVLAPQSGIVHQLEVHTVGGVVSAGEPLMQIVPQKDLLNVQAKVDPQMIDRIHIGQQTRLRFTAFDQRTTPEVQGEVEFISADSTHDQKTGSAFYTIKIRLESKELARLRGHKIMPGMPVEAFIQESERTVLSYLLKPMEDQMQKTFRER